jgi:hypothetical protein
MNSFLGMVTFGVITSGSCGMVTITNFKGLGQLGGLLLTAGGIIVAFSAVVAIENGFNGAQARPTGRDTNMMPERHIAPR